MGVYIKGMELPNEGVEWICFVRLTNRTAEFFDPTGEYESVFYKALEVPAHGRLVDAYALMGRIEHDTPLSSTFEKIVRRYIEDAPTIIQAEEGE